MTTVLSPVDTTTNGYRKCSVRWARRALQPGAAVILGIQTTTPEAGAMVEIAIVEYDVDRLQPTVAHRRRRRACRRIGARATVTALALARRTGRAGEVQVGRQPTATTLRSAWVAA